jgi:hypothetical protein
MPAGSYIVHDEATWVKLRLRRCCATGLNGAQIDPAGRVARMFDNLPKMAYSYETVGAASFSWRKRLANLLGGDLWRSEQFGKLI